MGLGKPEEEEEKEEDGMGWDGRGEERPGAASRPLQGQKKERLSILSLCLVLS